VSTGQTSAPDSSTTDDLTDEGSPEELGSDDARSRSARKPAKARVELLEQEGEIAADYLEGLLDIADLDGDIDMDVEGDRASVSIVGADLKQLVGRGGTVLDAVQELTRLAVLRATGERSRLMLDIGGFRAARRAELTELGRDAAQRAAKTGEPVRLNPMTPFERKVVHDAVAQAGMRSESDGEEPNRRVVVYAT
jgi:spoIIIJ-associated protein